MSTQMENWRLWACPRNANEAGLHTPGIPYYSLTLVVGFEQ
jgi:hypothetical protein